MRKTSQYYQQDRRRGRTISAVLHAVFLLFAIFGLPELMDYELPEEPAAITVEILPITGITNVKPQEKAPEPEPKEEPKPEPKKEEKKPTPPVKTTEAPPPPPPDAVPLPADKPKEKLKEKPKDPPKEKPKPKEPEKPIPKEEELDLEAVLKAVKDTAKKENDKEKKKDSGSQSKSISNRFDPSMQISMSEKDAIRSQIAKCWNMPAGAKNAHELVVVLRINLERDGSLIKVELASQSKSRYNQDAFFRTAADSAIRAVRQCTPLKGLPVDKFDGWRDIELTFDPKDMLY